MYFLYKINISTKNYDNFYIKHIFFLKILYFLEKIRDDDTSSKKEQKNNQFFYKISFFHINNLFFITCNM